MLPMLAKFLVLALMTSVVVSLGLFCGVQPSNRLAFGPTVAPFGPHAFNFTTPVFVAGLNAPIVAVTRGRVVGSITSSPPAGRAGGRTCRQPGPGRVRGRAARPDGSRRDSPCGRPGGRARRRGAA